jgi:hypothetical protein
MNVRLVGYGKVVSQSVKPGVEIYRGGLVELKLN